MHRIDDDTADPDENGPGRPGFTGGDPDLAIPATIVTPAWLNAVQEEIARAIELLEPLNPADNEQLRRVLSTLTPLALLPLNNVWTGINRFNGALQLMQELQYVNGAGVPTPKARTIRIPLTDLRADDATDTVAPGWTYGGGNGLYWVSTDKADTVALRGEFRLPAGTVLRGLRAECGSTVAGTVVGNLGISQVNEGGGIGSVVVASNSGSNNGAGMIDFTRTPTLLTSEDLVRVWFTSTAPLLGLYWLKLIVDDVGPRNF